MRLSFYEFSSKSWKRWDSLADTCQRRLVEQQIAPGNPGTILGEVETFLELVGLNGVVTSSRNASVPSAMLPELNRRSAYPIELRLKRALLRDYPNLAGIFVLLRVMDLLQTKGNRLVVSPENLERWRGLNPTEQYFALLEALLFHAQPSVLGGECRREECQGFEMITLFLGQLSERWHTFSRYESVGFCGPHGEVPPWNLFVQRQLGLLELRPRPPAEKRERSWGGQGWLVGRARLTPWGTAVVWALLEFVKQTTEQDELSRCSEPGLAAREVQIDFEEADSPPMDAARAPQKSGSGVSASNQDEVEFEDAPDEFEEDESGFGTLQPLFHTYFPEWQKVYSLSEPEVQSGTHIFKVALNDWRGNCGAVWRRLAVPADSSLDELARAILRAFKFDDDHVYDFRYRDKRGKNRVYNHPFCEEGPWTPDITVGETELALKDAMRFTFDYGDSWNFEVRLEKIDAEENGVDGGLLVIESEGKAPEQYPQSDW